MEFLGFPKTPHLMWLGGGKPREDKVLSSAETTEFLSHIVVVEEKVDGANIGISLGAHGNLQVQNRGTLVAWESAHPQFKPLRLWLDVHRGTLTSALGYELILFGEWCYATHSIHYTRLPDWFLAFDVYDRSVGRFWSVDRRDSLVKSAGLASVPRLARKKLDAESIQQTLGPSRFTDGPAEGIYVRWDRGAFLERRAKLVRQEFTQGMVEHWSSAPIRPNQLTASQKMAAP